MQKLFILYLKNYFGDPWNCFDFFIVLGSLIDIVYEQLNVCMAQIYITIVCFYENKWKVWQNDYVFDYSRPHLRLQSLAVLLLGLLLWWTFLDYSESCVWLSCWAEGKAFGKYYSCYCFPCIYYFDEIFYR